MNGNKTVLRTCGERRCYYNNPEVKSDCNLTSIEISVIGRCREFELTDKLKKKKESKK